MKPGNIFIIADNDAADGLRMRIPLRALEPFDLEAEIAAMRGADYRDLEHAFGTATRALVFFLVGQGKVEQVHIPEFSSSVDTMRSSVRIQRRGPQVPDELVDQWLPSCVEHSDCVGLPVGLLCSSATRPSRHVAPGARCEPFEGVAARVRRVGEALEIGEATPGIGHMQIIEGAGPWMPLPDGRHRHTAGQAEAAEAAERMRLRAAAGHCTCDDDFGRAVRAVVGDAHRRECPQWTQMSIQRLRTAGSVAAAIATQVAAQGEIGEDTSPLRIYRSATETDAVTYGPRMGDPSRCRCTPTNGWPVAKAMLGDHHAIDCPLRVVT